MHFLICCIITTLQANILLFPKYTYYSEHFVNKKIKVT